MNPSTTSYDSDCRLSLSSYNAVANRNMSQRGHDAVGKAVEYVLLLLLQHLGKSVDHPMVIAELSEGGALSVRFISHCRRLS